MENEVQAKLGRVLAAAAVERPQEQGLCSRHCAARLVEPGPRQGEWAAAQR